MELRGCSTKPWRGWPCRRILRHRAHLGQQVGKVLANHGKGFAIESEVAGLGLEDAAVPLLQILPRKTMPFFRRGALAQHSDPC